MTDMAIIREAERVGYPVFWQHDKAWFWIGDQRVGPFNTVDDAAYATLQVAALEQARDEDCHLCAVI